MRVTVVGAGVAGLTAALALAERGCAVEVFERGAVAWGCRPARVWAGGMLAPWCERETAEELVVELGREAFDWWPRHHPDTVRRGTLVLASRRDEPDLDRFARRTRGHQRARRGGHRGARARSRRPLRPAGCSSPRRPISTPGPRWPRSPSAWAARRGDPLRRRGRGACSGPVVDCRGLAARDRLPDLRGVKGEMLVVRCPDSRSAGRCGCCTRASRSTSCRAARACS